MENDLAALLRVALATALGGVLGWEREATGKQAGFRTHMLVALGAASFVTLGEAMVVHFNGFGDDLRFDPIRIIEAVVAGVSFLGAGTIFVSRSGDERVRGLTTAASIWATAAIGLAAGLGRWALAIGATVLALAVLRGMIWLERSRAKTAEPPA